MNCLKHSGDERACQRALRAKRLLTTSVFQFRIQIVDKILFGVHAQVSFLKRVTGVIRPRPPPIPKGDISKSCVGKVRGRCGLMICFLGEGGRGG